MTVDRIPIADIGSKDRLRPVDEGQARALSFSMEKDGLINPITIRATPASKDGKYTLIAGAHRLRAAQLLGWIGIPTIIVKADAKEAQMMEISENFFRNDLSVIDRAAFGERFRELWEEKHGPINSRKPREVASNLAATYPERFEDAVAKRLGLSKSGAKRLHRIARDLHPYLRDALRGTEIADNESQLLSLAKREKQEQIGVANAIKLYGHREGLKALKAPKAKLEVQRQLLNNFLTAWSAMNPETKAEALEVIGVEKTALEQRRSPKRTQER